MIEMEKRIYNILAVAALAATVFIGCGKQPFAGIEGAEGSDWNGHTLTFSCEMPSGQVNGNENDWSLVISTENGTSANNGRTDTDAGTKTLLKNGHVLWSAGDAIALAYVADGKWSGSLYESEALEAYCEKALFSVKTASFPDEVKTLRFYALYPAGCAEAIEAGLPQMSVNIPEEQTWSADGTFDSAADIMVAKSAETFSSIPAEPVSLEWNRIVAHLNLRLSSPAIPEGEKLKYVVLTADENAVLAGTHTLSIASGEITPSSGTDKHNSLTIKFPDTVYSKAEFAEGISLTAALLPCTIKALEVKVITDKAEYTRTINPTEPLMLGKDRLHTMNVDMQEAQRISTEAPEGLDTRIFSLLNLNAEGLETVKAEYGKGHLTLAAAALKEYWKNRNTVTNPDVNLNVTLSASDRNIADQALRENGYRFYVKNYSESTDAASGLPVFHSFKATDGSIDWNIKPTTETQFSLQKHRHQWIEPQAKAYNATGDEKYVQAIVEVYSDWLDAFPCPVAGKESYVISSGDKIWYDLQATSRLQTYINVIDRCIGADAFTPEFLTRVLVSLYDLTECIMANPYFKKANNHRLYEADAVYEAAVLLPEFRRNGAWNSYALSEIEEQLSVQFAEDGVQNEMDPGYHISVISLFNHISTMAQTNGKSGSLPADYDSSLIAACGFVRDIVYPDYSIEDFNDTRSSSWTKSVLKRNFSSYSNRFPSEGTFEWMATERKSGNAPSENFSAYRHSGWYMFRSGWEQKDMMLILKNNYNADKWWHCQPDNGTVSLYRNGRHFLPDAGSFTYGGDDVDDGVRDEFRDTRSHNTITYGGATIADGNMKGEFVAESHTEEYDAVHTKNQSYPALRHERTVFYVKNGGYFVIADSAIGSAAGSPVAIHWHFCPPQNGVPGESMETAKDALSYTSTTSFTDGNNMMFKTFCFSGEKGIVPTSEWSAEEGTSFTSGAIGVKTERPCCSIAVHKTESTPVRFITVIYPISSATQAPKIQATYTGTSQIKLTVGTTTQILQIP